MNDELSETHAREVERHLDLCRSCETLLQRLVGKLPGSDRPARADDSAAADTVPSANVAAVSTIQIPGYEILGELGRGGMGVVYKARQLRPNRIVALKVLLSGAHAGAAERVRFLHEAEAVARLQHPHIVALYEAGEHGELPYLTLEFVSGGSLALRLRGTPLSPDDAAWIVEQLARAMHHAHEHGIIHRDLKPANVLLHVDSAPQDMLGPPQLASVRAATPKITDFGLAKNVAVSADLTPSNIVCGTPAYMAPEQAAANSKQLGAAADVYALGAILYECLTGRPPFQGPTPADTLLQVLSEEPVAPSRLQRTVPRDLETIALKCLHKEPARRYASAQELADDLHRFQVGEPIVARPVGLVERALKWTRRHPTVALLLTAVVLLTVLAGTLVTWQWQQAVAALAEARSEKEARAKRQVKALLEAAPGRVSAILEELAANSTEVMPLLRELYQQEKDQPRRMRVALALLPIEPHAVRSSLVDWLLQAEDPAEVLLVRAALFPHAADLVAQLWATADDARIPAGRRFRALVALAAFDPASPNWPKAGSQVVEHLLWANPLHRGLWEQAFQPIGQALLGSLKEASYLPLGADSKWHYRMETSDGKKGQVMQQIAKIEHIDGLALARLETVAHGEVVASEHLNSTAKGLFRYRYNGSEISPAVCLLKFPIQVGETWESEHVSGQQKFKARFRVGGEDIEVPAGKYKTVCVHITADVGEATLVTSYWFAPGVGLVKQVATDKRTVTLELENFEPGR